MIVEVRITTDDYPAETSWSLRNECTNQMIAIGSGYSLAKTLHTSTSCLTPASYAFTINDSYSDGICCNYGSGSYSVVVDGVTTLTGGQFTNTETKTFGTSCAVSPHTIPHNLSYAIYTHMRAFTFSFTPKAHYFAAISVSHDQ
jgi:hypothetical protein